MRFERSISLAVLTFLVAPGCGGPAPTPTTVVGTWSLASVDGAMGGSIPARNVLQIELKEAGGTRFVSCLDPVYEGTSLLTCHERLVCATGTYTFRDGTIMVSQTATTTTHHGSVKFAPGEMVLGGEFFGPTYAAIHFEPLDALSTDCISLP